MVVMAFSSLARILGRMSYHYFPPALFFFFSGDQIAHTNPNSRISLQWLNELRRLWPNVSWRTTKVKSRKTFSVVFIHVK